MYDWLSEALNASGTVITANRRLARIFKSVHAELQRAAGKQAWRSPRISAWNDWLLDCCNLASLQDTLPTRINAHQSQWLWEQCWRQEVGERDVGMTQLVRLSRDTWQRMADWQIPISEIVRAAQNDDQRTFAAVASRYRSVLQRNEMVDDAGMAPLLLDLVLSGRVPLTGAHTFAGFDRQRPIAVAIKEAMREAGIVTNIASHGDGNQVLTLQELENEAAELRAAGRWARELLESNAEAQVAIIADGLDSDAERIARLVREGFTPGWQTGHRAMFEALNVSYGRRLAEFPAIVIAQTALRWLLGDMPSKDVCLLLRSPLLGSGPVSGRSQLDLMLRTLPDREWSPAMLTSELGGRVECPGANDWFERIASLSLRRRQLPKSASPADWAVFFDDTLKQLGWPGQESLDSGEFQLVNRWRELLNEFARLALVSPQMTRDVAMRRLEMMAADTIFQPESTRALLQLMGPLEAAGAEFDAVWITGFSSANWPPAGSPSQLISKRLQEERAMPDSTPADTLQYAEKILQRLVGAAPTVVGSFAHNVDDSEQTASDLLGMFTLQDDSAKQDPGWYANQLLDMTGTEIVADRVPPLIADEKLRGGAGVIEQQMSEPLGAFVGYRLGARTIDPQAYGIPALMRGNLLHSALYHLYRELPSAQTICSWVDGDLDARIDAALDSAFARYQKNANRVVRKLLLLERARLAILLRQFVALDCARQDFKVASVEGEFEFKSGPVRLDLRFDRLDQFGDGSYMILDYKSGARKQLLNSKGEIKAVQLFVYTCAIDATVSALALVNIDSREISFDGAGRGYTDVAEWPALLQQVQGEIGTACADLSAGDVRIAVDQDVKSARPLNPLSRYTEWRRDVR